MMTPERRQEMVEKKYPRDVKGNEYMDLRSRLQGYLYTENDAQIVSRRERRQDGMFYDGDVVDYDSLARRLPRYRDLKINMIRTVVDSIAGMLKDRNIEGKITPTGISVHDSEMWDIVTNSYARRLEHIKQTSKFHKHRNRMVDMVSKCGEAFIKDGVELDPDDPERIVPYFRYTDWRNILVDSRSEEADLSDAMYLFEVYRHDLSVKKVEYPNFVAELERLADDYTLARGSSDYLEDGYGGADREGSHGSGTGLRESVLPASTSNRRLVNVGQAWWFETIEEKKGGKYKICCNMEFATDSSCMEYVPLSPVRHRYAHNRIPFSRVCYARFTRDGQPYSPAVRDRRGIQRSGTTTLRRMLVQLYTRSMKVNMLAMKDALTNSEQEPKVEITKQLNLLRTEAYKPVALFQEWGPSGTLELNLENADLQQGSALLKMLYELSQSTHAIDPSLLGQKTNIDAAIALQTKASQAHSALSSLFDSFDDAVVASFERMLANIKEFSGLIDYGPIFDDNGDLQIIDQADDITVSKNKVQFTIVPESKDKSLIKDQMTLMMQLAQKMDPSMGAAYLPLIVRAAGLPENHKMVRAMFELNSKMGLPVPSSMLPDSIRKQAEEAEQAQQQQQQQAMQTAHEKEVAEIELNRAKAAAEIAKAQSLSDGEGQGEGKSPSGGEERDTIKQLSQENELLVQRLTNNQ